MNIARLFTLASLILVPQLGVCSSSSSLTASHWAQAMNQLNQVVNQGVLAMNQQTSQAVQQMNHFNQMLAVNNNSNASASSSSGTGSSATNNRQPISREQQRQAVEKYLELTIEYRNTNIAPGDPALYQRNEIDLLAELLEPGCLPEARLFNMIDVGDVVGCQQLLESKLVTVNAHDDRDMVDRFAKISNLTGIDLEEICTKLPELNKILEEIQSHSTPAAYLALVVDEVTKCMRGLSCWNKLNDIVQRCRRHVGTGFLPLHRAAAHGNTDIIKLLLNHRADAAPVCTLRPWMAPSHIVIDEQILEHHSFKDLTHPVTHATRTNLFDLILKNHNINYLADNLDPLQLAAIAGHTEAVEALLAHITADLDEYSGEQAYKNVIRQIINPIYGLINHSNMERCPEVTPILNLMGIHEEPKYGNYPAIIKRLFKAIATILQLEDDGGYALDTDEGIRYLLRTIMLYGSEHVARAPAEAFAKTPVESIQWERPTGQWDYNKFPPAPVTESWFERLVRDTNCGEKVGILFSINADPKSAVWQLREGMLEYLQKNPKQNPEFLRRLKNYVEEERATARNMKEVNKKLIPDLAAIVSAYAAPHPVSKKVAAWILAIDRQVPLAYEEKEQKERKSDEKKDSSSASNAKLNQRKQQELLARLTELQNVIEQNKITGARLAALNVMQLVKTQPYTADVLRLTRELVSAINTTAKINYVESTTTLNFLLEPIKTDLAKEITRLASGK